MKKIAVVTGALKGIGLQVAKDLARKDHGVILSGRDEIRGKTLQEQLARDGLKVSFHCLDVGNPESIEDFTARLLREFGHIDILVNNAGICPQDREDGDTEPLIDGIERAFQTNALGPYLLCRRLLPSMLKNNFGRVVNVSTGMAQLSDMNAGSPAYRMSKVALNAVTRMFADQCKGKNVLVNSVCPGWVRTDMGGPGATRSLEQGSASILWAVNLGEDGPNGGFFRDGKRLDF
jgi:NAD(P)-dependent dehydrogenase (short-subunit alcohol dehydrogenase family)